MKLNTYKSQTEVDKTFEVDAYDIMYGTVEDLFAIMDGAKDDTDEIMNLLVKNRGKINDLIKDVFPGMTDEDLRKIKLKDLVPFFIELFSFVQKSFERSSKN